MSTAIKNNRLSSEEKTAEFELPDFSKKGNIVPPVPAIQQKVQILKTESKQINTQLDQVKTEAVRKVDEPTRVFNLRQAQLVDKIKELETRKLQTERAIKKMLEEKNATLHTDLTKATQSLVEESQRFAPLEKELGSGIAKLATIRNELQNFFEMATNERKKNSQAIFDQGTEIENLQKIVHSCNELMAKEYAQLSHTLRPLLDEKVELEKACLHFKSEHSNFDTEIKLLESKKFTLEVTHADLVRKIESHKYQEAEQGKFLEGLHAKIEEVNLELAQCHARLSANEQQKEKVLSDIQHLHDEHDSIQKSGESLKWSLVSLNEQHEQKKNSLSKLDHEISDFNHRIKDLRSQEADLIKSCANFSSQLHHLQGEVAGLEATRAAAMKLQEEAMEFLNERRNFYHLHVQDLEHTHKAKMGQLEKEYQDQKADWDKNFHELEENQKAELDRKLEAYTVEYHAILKESQNVLMDDVVKVVKRHLTRTVFESGQQRAELAKDELEPLMKNYFNQSVRLATRPWHNWKPWMWATSASWVVITGLVVKILWFK